MEERLEALVSRYYRQRDEYRRADSRYSEADTRADFIDPFFALLGWDIANERGLPPRLREVIRETRVSVDENTKRPDYVFKLGPERRFFVEAKTPNVDLLNDPRPAFQVRRYGWSADLMASVVMNFETLVVYDTTTQPSPDHPSNHSRLYVFSYDEYIDRLEEIAALLSRNAVYSGAFDTHFSTQVRKRPGEAIDAVFLQTLNKWRRALGHDIVSRRPDIDQQILNEIVQRFILRILFLRMAEDRGIQTYEALKALAESNDWQAFVAMLRESDRRFDSELFDTSRDPFCGTDGAALRLDSITVTAIIESLYFPQAPYTFSVFEPEFIGDVYEQFLIERLSVQGGTVVLEPKPENVDRDVIPTPRPLIERIVQDIVEPIVRNATPDEILELRIVDPASGSGGFLIAAFDVLMSRAIEAYLEAGDDEAVYETGSGYQLAFERKCKILTSCLFGVDRDFLAVEVTRFGLLVKLLEQESAETLPTTADLLPSLEGNIVFGDSLVDERIYADHPQPSMIGVPLSWGQQITSPYSIVIGNPPYLFTEAMVNQEPTEYEFYRQHYASAYRQFDKYYLFIERALVDLMQEDGLFGMVVSRKFTHIESGRKLRALISRGRHLVRLVDFGTAQLFENRTTYTCLLFLSKSGVPVPDDEEEDTFDYELVTTPQDWLSGLVGAYSNRIQLPRELVSGDAAWLLPSTPEELELVLALLRDTIPLGDLFDVFNGIQTSRNSVYVISEWEDVDDNLVAFIDQGQRWLIEKEILRPFFDDSLAELRSFCPMPDTARVIFPYFVEPQDDGSLQARVIPPDVMRSCFPNAYAWLESNVETLKDRDIRPAPYPEDEWYRFGRDQALTVFEDRPKIVVGVNSLGDKYVYDETDTLLASGGTAGECAIAPYREPERQTPYDLYFVLAILNHKAIEYYCRKRGSPFRGGWYARGTAVLKTVPVPHIDFRDPDAPRTQLYTSIVATSKDLCNMYNELDKDLSSQQRIRHQRRAKNLQRRMDEQVSELFGILTIINEIELPT